MFVARCCVSLDPISEAFNTALSAPNRNHYDIPVHSTIPFSKSGHFGYQEDSRNKNSLEMLLRRFWKSRAEQIYSKVIS